MKVALVTDTHFGCSNNTQKIHFKFLKNLMKESFDVLVHTGDIASHKQKQLKCSLSMFRDALGDIPMLVVLGNHDCLDKETELLTHRGWLSYKEIRDSDLILSINKKGYSEWSSIDQIIIKKANKMYRYNDASLDMCITKKHRILCGKRNDEKNSTDLFYTTLKDMGECNYCFPVAAKNSNLEYPITNSEIISLGLSLSNGTLIKDKKIFNQFSNRQLQLFLHTLMQRIGWWVEREKAGGLYGTLDILGWVQSLAVQCGVSTSLVEFPPGEFRLNLEFDKEFVQVDTFTKKIKVVEYNDEVWCLNVPNTNFMVRRNGKACFTGNCWDQESWNNNNPRYNKKISYEQMKVTQREWFEEFNIHYLQDGEFLYKNDVVFYGYDGWYHSLPPPSNDKYWMPRTAKMCPIDQYLNYRANKTLDVILMSAKGMSKQNPNLKKVCATHHSLLSYRDGNIAMGGDPRHLDFLSEDFDYVFYGHSHLEVDTVHEFVQGNCVFNCRVLNAGSDYNIPKYKIIEI